MSICEHADHAGVVQLRAELVAEEASVSVGTARKHIVDLEANGYLVRGKLRTYTVLLTTEPRAWGGRAGTGAPRSVAAAAQILSPSRPLDPDQGHVFVREGTRAYDAWACEMARRNGRSWHLSVRRQIDGRWFTGWYFPTLFPGGEPLPACGETGSGNPASREDDDGLCE